MNRAIQPDYGVIEDFDFEVPEVYVLSNGLKVYPVSGNYEEALKIDIYFNAGGKYHSHPLVASAANALLTEGTLKKSSAELAEVLDLFGCFIDKDCGPDQARVSIYALDSNLEKILGLVKEMFESAIYPEHELEIYKNIRLQKLQVSKEKNAWVANQEFVSRLYPDGHPYGRRLDESVIESLVGKDIRHFYRQLYSPQNCHIILSGKVTNHTLDLFNKILGDGNWNKEILPFVTFDNNLVSVQSQTGKFNMVKENSIQAALKYGKVLFNRSHHDFFGMQILCTLLGGYFGSRLMKNIREEKGYTYGIGCSLVPMRNSAYFVISSEVKNEAKQLTIQEIEKEIVTLQDKLVGNEELLLVKNYMSGSFLRMFDGVFSKAERVNTLVSNDLPNNYYSLYLDKIKSITADELKILALKYLKTNEITEVIVG